MMTGYASHDSARLLQNLRADAYLSKPFEIGTLIEMLGLAIARRRSRAKLRADVTEGKPQTVVNRIAVVEPNEKDRARLARLIGDQKLVPLARAELAGALTESPLPDGLVVNSASLSLVSQQRVIELQTARPEFQVVLISASDNLADAITSIVLDASGQLFRPWTDERATQALREAFVFAGLPR